MVTGRLVGGKLLTVGGAVAIADECCCVDCPPLTNWPVLCSVTIETLEGNLVAPVITADVDNKWTSGVSPLDGTHAALLYDVVAKDDYEYAGTCNDNVCSIPWDDSENCIFNCCVGELDPETACDCISLEYENGTLDHIWEGDIIYALRRLVSRPYFRLRYFYDCVTQKKYRKVLFHYNYSLNLQGRFVGYESIRFNCEGITTWTEDCPSEFIQCTGVYTSEADYVALGMDVRCGAIDDFDNTVAGGHGCDEFPQFNSVPGENYDTGHEWLHVDNLLGFVVVPQGFEFGLFFATAAYVYYEDLAWVELGPGEDFFDLTTLTPTVEIPTGLNMPAWDSDPGAGVETVAEFLNPMPTTVYPSGYNEDEFVTWHLNCALLTTWTYWDVGCDREVTADAPYPPEVVEVDDTYAWGTAFEPHAISFTTAATAAACP